MPKTPNPHGRFSTDPKLKSIFSQRFNQALDEHDVPKLNLGRHTTVAERYGISEPCARKWVAGLGIPSWRSLIMIADDLGCSIDFLLGREANIKRIKTKAIPVTAKEQSPQQKSLGLIAFDEGVLRTAMRVSQNGIDLMVVTSDSMSPTLVPGDIVFIDTLTMKIEDGGIYAFTTVDDEQVLIRRVSLGILDKKIVLESQNLFFKQISLEKHEIQIGNSEGEFKLKLLGQISWIIKKVSGSVVNYKAPI